MKRKAVMKAIILAAGQGTRMRSSLHKLLHPVLGKTVIRCVVDAAYAAGIKYEDTTVVVSPNSDDIQAELNKFCPGVKFAIQDTPLGTGHAVESGIGNIEDSDNVIVLYGDMPLLTGNFIYEAIKYYRTNNCCAIVTALLAPHLKDFGRVYFDGLGYFNKIIEARDLTHEHQPNDWVNPGVYIFKGDALRQGLKGITNENSQDEYYLTDAPRIINESGKIVRVYKSTDNPALFTGVNNQIQLAEAVEHMQTRINTNHMKNGVRIISPTSVYIDSTVVISGDTVIYPGAIIEGNCKIERGAIVGANTHMKDTVLKEYAHIRQSVTDGAIIGAYSEVGPFAYLRPGTIIGERCRIGNFVEIKNSTLGNDTKMAHLAYIGDADVGNGVNYSCGAITANYDGKKKHRTTIKDGAFVGCNVNLVAPVTVGEGAFAAAGSTITDDLPSDALGIARAKQVQKLDWKKK